MVTPETVMRYKSIVKASVLEMIDNTKDQHHHNKYVEIFHLIYGRKTDTGYVRGELDKALRMQSITKKKNDNDNLTSRKVDQTSGNFINLYIAAIDTLNNLSPDDNPKINELWQRVAISLMLVTGRRLSEIMSSAKFSETVRFGWVMFEGQLKTKESNSEPYEIPIMVDYQIIKKAMDWLETNNKRNPDPQKAHQLYSKPLSGAIKKFNSLMEIIDSGEKTSLTCHSCRQIYAQIFKESSEIDGSPHKRISSILGHGKNDNSTADRYDADFEVKDARAILELLGRGVR